MFVVAVLHTTPTVAQQKPIERIPAADFGVVFPTGSFQNLNPAAGKPEISLDQTLGKKPIVLFYWIPGNQRADDILLETQALARKIGADKLTLFVAALPRPGRGVDVIQAAIERLGVQVPVLHDEGFRIGQQIRVDSVPHIAVIDQGGRLRLTNGASLKQTLEYNMNVGDAIERVTRTGTLGTYNHLPRYYPVKELVGDKCPDFTAPLLATSVERQWSSMLVDDKVNVLIFWSVDCPHCRSSLPELNAWLLKNSDGLNVVSAAKVTSEAGKIKTQEFCDNNQFAFRTLADVDLKISSLYQITTTPTVVIIGPDGTVDSVILSGDSVADTLERKKRELLKPAAS
jgi:peroxiredoxin